MNTKQISEISQVLMPDDLLKLLNLQYAMLDQQEAGGGDVGHFHAKLSIIKQQIELQKQLIALDDKYQMSDLGIDC